MNSYERAGRYIAGKRRKFQFPEGLSNAAADAEFVRFRAKYNPDILRATAVNEVYDTFFRLDAESMIQEMRRRGKKVIIGSLGHLSQWGNNFPFYTKDHHIIVGRGMLQSGEVVTVDYACRIGEQLIHGLADCADYAGQIEFSSIEDYRSFEAMAKRKLGEQATRDWVHKYLSIIHPYLFTEFQGKEYRHKALKALGIVPDDSAFGTDWQFLQIKKYAGIEHPYEFARNVYNIREVNEAILGKTIRVIVLTEAAEPDTTACRDDSRKQTELNGVETPVKVEQPKQVIVSIGEKLLHKAFGEGVVYAVDGKYIKVRFDLVGEKTFINPDGFNNGFLKKM